MLRPAMVATLGRKTRRFIAQDHDDLVFDVEVGVVVVVELVGGYAVSGKDWWRGNFARRRKTEGDKFIADAKIFLCGAILHREAVSGFQFRSRDKAERLGETRDSRRLKMEFHVAFFDQVLR